MNTIDGLIHKMDRAAEGMIGATRSGVNVAAQVMAKAVDVSILADTHGTGVLRGMGSKKQLRARVNPAGSAMVPVALVNTNSAGTMAILERGARRHVVGSGVKGAQGTARNRFGVLHTVTKSGGKSYTAKLMKMPDGSFAWGPFEAGGSPAKHTFSNAANLATPKVVAAVRGEVVKSLGGIFH